MRFGVRCFLAIVWCSVAVAAEGNAVALPQEAAKLDEHKPADVTSDNSLLSHPNLEKQVSVDEKGVKTLKLIGNDPNFEAEHAKWQQQHDAAVRARTAAAAEEQRKQAEAQAAKVTKQPSASDAKEKKRGALNEKKQAAPKRVTQKNKRPVYTLWGGGTVP